MEQTERPIRILRIISQLNISGPSLHAILLTEKLRKQGYDSVLVSGPAANSSDDASEFATEHDVEPLILPELGNKPIFMRNIRAAVELYKLIQSFQPDVIHAHTMKAGFLGRVAAWLAGVPVIVYTFHEYPFDGYFSRFVTQRFIWIERLGARLSDSIITLSAALRQKLTDTYKITRKSHVTILPLGMDLDPFVKTRRKRGHWRAQWSIPEDAPLVGIIGRLMPVKNHALFLNAAVQVKAQIPDARFVIVGDGGLRKQLEAQVATLGLGSSVIFTGWQKDIAPIYGELDVTVISSLNEGTPVPVIEALAAGCPVVATQVGGLTDLLDHGQFGRLVPPDDAEALAEAIIDTLHEPPDTTQAQQAMLDRYSIDRLVTDLDALYRGLLTKKQS